MKALSTLFFSILTVLSSNVLAHGEDIPGPHGGYIRMPGAFHTEVVNEKEGYRIYLLDINWKNPSVLDSSVLVSIEFDKKKVDLTCKKEKDSYFCKSSIPQRGVLNIHAKREGQSGAVATYKLPLKFEIPQNEMPEHQGH